MLFSQESFAEEDTKIFEQEKALALLENIPQGKGFRLWLKIDDKLPSVEECQEVSFQTEQEREDLLALISDSKEEGGKVLRGNVNLKIEVE